MFAEEGNNDKIRSIYEKFIRGSLAACMSFLQSFLASTHYFMSVQMNCFSYCNTIHLKICQDICVGPFTGKTYYRMTTFLIMYSSILYHDDVKRVMQMVFVDRSGSGMR